MQLMARWSPGEVLRPLLQTAWRVAEARSTMALYARAASVLGAHGEAEPPSGWPSCCGGTAAEVDSM
eukprot:742307-Pyramimonas_sp.AAC.1